MSQESFAAVSVATAVICGVFFYPPPPESRSASAQAVRASHVASVAARPPATMSLDLRATVSRAQAAIHRTGVLNTFRSTPRVIAPPGVEPKGNAT